MGYGCIVIANSKNGIVPAIIRFITKGPSHSLITIPDSVGVPMCMEAADVGIAVLRFDKGYTQNADQEISIFEVNVPDVVKDKAIAVCFDRLETSYGFLELPWFIWRSLNKLFGKDIKKNDNWSQNGTICSELCRLYLTECGLGYLFDGFGKSSLNAKDLQDILLANPQLFTLSN